MAYNSSTTLSSGVQNLQIGASNMYTRLECVGKGAYGEVYKG